MVIFMKIILKESRFKRYFGFVLFILIFAFLLFVSLNVIERVNIVFKEKAVHMATVKATHIINTSIAEITENAAPEDFVDIKTGDSGIISSVSANTVSINRFKAKLANHLENDKLDDCIIYIPLGSLTDFAALENFGYKIPVSVSFDGISKLDFDDEFVSCGINQVKHKIFLTLEAEISVISKSFIKSRSVSCEVPVAETVIVGNVPTYYGDNLSVVGR